MQATRARRRLSTRTLRPQCSCSIKALAGPAGRAAATCSPAQAPHAHAAEGFVRTMRARTWRAGFAILATRAERPHADVSRAQATSRRTYRLCGGVKHAMVVVAGVCGRARAQDMLTCHATSTTSACARANIVARHAPRRQAAVRRAARAAVHPPSLAPEAIGARERVSNFLLQYWLLSTLSLGRSGLRARREAVGRSDRARDRAHR